MRTTTAAVDLEPFQSKYSNRAIYPSAFAIGMDCARTVPGAHTRKENE